MEPELSILFLCTFPKMNKNGVQRFAMEIINGIKSREPQSHVLYWNKEGRFLRSYIELLKKFLSTIKKVKIVHFVSLTPYNIPFIILAKILRKKILISYHGNYLAEVSSVKRPHIFIPFWIADKISRAFSDIIVSASAYLLKEMKIKEKNSYIIPYPFNLKILNNSTKKGLKTHAEEILFATASNFNIKEKVEGLNYLFEAMNTISKDDVNIKLLVFGNGKYLDSFKVKFENNQKIIFMGFREDFKDYLTSVDVYIHISGLDNQPYAIIEALMNEKVILCNDLGGLIEMVDPVNNYIVPLDSTSVSKTLYNIIKDIKNNPTEFYQKGNRNKMFALNRYSSEIASTKYIKLYNILLSNN